MKKIGVLFLAVVLSITAFSKEINIFSDTKVAEQNEMIDNNKFGVGLGIDVLSDTKLQYGYGFSFRNFDNIKESDVKKGGSFVSIPVYAVIKKDFEYLYVKTKLGVVANVGERDLRYKNGNSENFDVNDFGVYGRFEVGKEFDVFYIGAFSEVTNRKYKIGDVENKGYVDSYGITFGLNF